MHFWFLAAALLLSASFAAAGCDDSTTPERARLAELQRAHQLRVVNRFASRVDADAATVRLYLAPGPDWDPAMWCDPDQALQARLSQKAQASWSERAHAVLDAPDLQASHALAVLGRVGARDSAGQRALTWLLHHDPSNLAALAFQLNDGQHHLTEAEIDARLQRVAAAEQDFASGPVWLANLLTEAAAGVAAEPELIELTVSALSNETGVEENAYSNEDIARVANSSHALVILMAGLPTLGGLVNVCDPRQSVDFSGLREQACLEIGRQMAEKARLLLDQRIGLSIWERIEAHRGAPSAEVLDARRRSDWQMAEATELQSTQSELAVMLDAIESVRSGRWEVEHIHDRLLAAGVSLDPPADWQRQRPGQQAR